MLQKTCYTTTTPPPRFTVSLLHLEQRPKVRPVGTGEEIESTSTALQQTNTTGAFLSIYCHSTQHKEAEGKPFSCF